MAKINLLESYLNTKKLEADTIARTWSMTSFSSKRRQSRDKCSAERLTTAVEVDEIRKVVNSDVINENTAHKHRSNHNFMTFKQYCSATLGDNVPSTSITGNEFKNSFVALPFPPLIDDSCSYDGGSIASMASFADSSVIDRLRNDVTSVTTTGAYSSVECVCNHTAGCDENDACAKIGTELCGNIAWNAASAKICSETVAVADVVQFSCTKRYNSGQLQKISYPLQSRDIVDRVGCGSSRFRVEHTSNIARHQFDTSTSVCTANGQQNGDNQATAKLCSISKVVDEVNCSKYPNRFDDDVVKTASGSKLTTWRKVGGKRQVTDDLVANSPNQNQTTTWGRLKAAHDAKAQASANKFDQNSSDENHQKTSLLPALSSFTETLSDGDLQSASRSLISSFYHTRQDRMRAAIICSQLEDSEYQSERIEWADCRESRSALNLVATPDERLAEATSCWSMGEDDEPSDDLNEISDSVVLLTAAQRRNQLRLYFASSQSSSLTDSTTSRHSDNKETRATCSTFGNTPAAGGTCDVSNFPYYRAISCDSNELKVSSSTKANSSTDSATVLSYYYDSRQNLDRGELRPAQHRSDVVQEQLRSTLHVNERPYRLLIHPTPFSAVSSHLHLNSSDSDNHNSHSITDDENGDVTFPRCVSDSYLDTIQRSSLPSMSFLERDSGTGSLSPTSSLMSTAVEDRRRPVITLNKSAQTPSEKRCGRWLGRDQDDSVVDRPSLQHLQQQQQQIEGISRFDVDEQRRILTCECSDQRRIVSSKDDRIQQHTRRNVQEFDADVVSLPTRQLVKVLLPPSSTASVENENATSVAFNGNSLKLRHDNQSTTSALTHHNELIEDVSKAVKLLISYYDSLARKESEMTTGSRFNRQSEAVKLIIQRLCPAIHAVLLDGLRPYTNSIFGKVRNTAWTVVEETTRLGGHAVYTNVLHRVKLQPRLKSPWLLFNAFVIALLNAKALGSWFIYVCLNHVTLLQRYYDSTAIMTASIKTRRSFLPDNTVLPPVVIALADAVRPLCRLPIQLELTSEVQLMESPSTLTSSCPHQRRRLIDSNQSQGHRNGKELSTDWLAGARGMMSRWWKGRL